MDTIDISAAMAASLPADEQMAETRRKREEDRKINDAAEGFCPIDLGDWIDLARTAGVPYVPSEVIASAPIMSLLRYDEEGPHTADLKAFNDAFRSAVEGKSGTHMARWSCCSMADLKYSMNSGSREWRDAFLDLYPDDMRAYDILWEVPRSFAHAHLRPWIDLRTRKSEAGEFALEVRAFVDDGAVKGISAYYPQCPMSWDDPDAVRLVGTAFDYAARMLKAQGKPLIMPQMPELHLQAGNAWTADFVMTAAGEVLFLEGGPPHTPRWGAHPCCFEGREPIGIALA